MHWSQTPAGKRRLKAAMKANWAKRKNGTAPPPKPEKHESQDAELTAIHLVVTTFGKLPKHAQEYVRTCIS